MPKENTKVRRLMRYGALGIPIAFAGLPLYVNVPRFYADTMHANLSQLGLIFLVLRLADTVIDPLIGALSDRYRHRRRGIMMLALPLLAGGYLLLFSPPHLSAEGTLSWLFCCLIAVYFAFSVLMINYYAMGVELASGYDDSTRFSAWREGCMLAGVLLASLLPTYLSAHYPAREAYQLFASTLIPLLIVCAAATLSLPSSKVSGPHIVMKENFAVLLIDRYVRWTLTIALLNAIPTAITSTLFLFFTADVLQAGAQSGPMLGVYFISAAGAMPFWVFISKRYSKRVGLMAAMLMAIFCFIWAWDLGAGDTAPFYIICVLSGMTLGADSALLPSLFSDALADKRGSAGAAFGMWNFTSKLTMALAAGIALPLLARGGYVPGGDNTARSLGTLSFCYALLPCLFKAVAFAMLYISPLDRAEIKETI